MEERPNPTDAAFHNVLVSYSLLVYRLAYVRTGNRHDADDIYQEVFLRYVKANPAFESEEHGKAWFIRVTVNLCSNLLKSAWRKRTVILSDQPGYMDDIQDEDYGELKAALLMLPPRSRTVIHLFYFENMTAEAIAKTLRMPASSVRVMLSRTRKKLKTYLIGEEAHVHV